MVSKADKPVFKPTEVQKVVDPIVDPMHLLLVDRDPDEEEIAKGTRLPTNEELLARTRDNVQYLFNEIWKLPRKVTHNAICATLPEKEVFRLPREKPIPPPREPTKWEAFAKEKGIQKRDRSKKVYDEATGEWKPTYGYRRAKDNTKDWMLEIPDQKDAYADHFGERIAKKKERIAKNQYQQMKNQIQAIKKSGKVNDEMAHVPLGVGGRAEASNKAELTKKVHKAKMSTASVGKFQPELKDEKAPKLGVKRKFEPNESSVKEEKNKQLNILKNLGAKKPKLLQSRFGASEQAYQKSAAADDREDNADSRKKSSSKKKPMGRGKSTVHRQQHFQKALKGSKGKGRGGAGGKKGGRK